MQLCSHQDYKHNPAELDVSRVQVYDQILNEVEVMYLEESFRGRGVVMQPSGLW